MTRLVSPRWERLSLVWRQDKEWWREETGSLHIFKDKWYPGIVRFEQWRKAIPWGRGIDREWRVCHQPGSFQGVCGGSEWEAPLLSFSYLLLHWFPKEAWRKLIRQPWMRSEAGRKEQKQPYHRVWPRTRSQAPCTLCPVAAKSRLAHRFNAFIYRAGGSFCPWHTCRWIACSMLLFLRWPELTQLFWFVGLAASFLTLRPWTQTQLQPLSQAKHGHGPGVGMWRSELLCKFFQQFLKVQEETCRVFVGIRWHHRHKTLCKLQGFFHLVVIIPDVDLVLFSHKTYLEKILE